MLSLIFAGIFFISWALLIISIYYSPYYSSVDHINVDYIRSVISADGFLASPFGKYIITIIILYSIYKIGSILFLSNKGKIQFSIFTIIGIFLLHLLILCGIYASMPEGNQMIIKIGSGSGASLFFHILSLLIYPVLISLISQVSGHSIMQKLIDNWDARDARISTIVDTSVGLFVFSILLLIIGALSLFNLAGLIIVLTIMSLIGWKNWKQTFKNIIAFRIALDHHQAGKGLINLIAPKLLSIEFSFFILTLMMSVAMISIIRPMPIGWDDLGVYMNFPKIMALTNELIPGAGIYSWQLITGSGFLFGYNASQAFFVNQLGSILAVIAIILGLSFLFEQKGKKALLSLPIILATVYYVMPMTVFHHTKDMKLDPALLFVSISVFMLFFSELKMLGNTFSKKNISILLIIGILIGFAFSIKVTTLMLLLGILGLLAYRFLSFWGYIGFFFLFLSVFSGLNLWSIMNVWMPSDAGIRYSIAITFGILGIISFVVASIKKLDILKGYILASGLIILGFLVGLTPWIIKNTSEVKPWNYIGDNSIDTKNLLLQSILGGSGAGFEVDMQRIISKEEYDKKTEILKNSNISSDGKTQNEDFGRYFGYEEGINNYVRLPINLTFQKNQGGEFTAITYIFLALIPTLFLFARGRFPWLYQGIISIGIIFIFFYSFTSHQYVGDQKQPSTMDAMLRDTLGEIIESKDTLTLNDISNILIKKPILEILSQSKIGDSITEALNLKNIQTNSLLYGYLILIIVNIGFLAVIHFLTKDEENDRTFRDMIVVLNIYGFLFLVSAFGIVWYGIFVYFIFFSLIGVLSRVFTDYDDTDRLDANTFAIKSTLTILLFLFISFYFLRTAIPHAWTNLRSAGFNEYKYSILDQESTIFTYRADYLVPIATMNLHDTQILTGSISMVKSPKVKEILTQASGDKIMFLEILGQLIPQLQASREAILRRDGQILAKYVYNTILYPTKETENTAGIYRIGTFMTYLIHKNQQRYYEDSLIFGFDGYFYEENPELTIEKMKKLGLKFLLIDLNAATIDRDPRRALTQRYEHLLLTMRANNLKLINTDNLCLRFALDEYRAGKLQTPDEFISIAGTNYEGYKKNEQGEMITIGRGQKQTQCYNAMLGSINNDNGSAKYDYLKTIDQAIQKNKAANNPELLGKIMSTYAGQSFFALYEIIDTPGSSTSQDIPVQSTTIKP